LVRDFKTKVQDEEPFFKVNKAERKPVDQRGEIEKLVIDYRKKYLSVPDIKIALDSLGYNVSEGYIYAIVHNAGFARLPRRGAAAKNETLSSSAATMTAPISKRLDFLEESFSSQLAGLLCALPVIARYGIHDIINESSYPQTTDINRLSSILSFVALKLSNVKRYSSDDTWCMDRILIHLFDLLFGTKLVLCERRNKFHVDGLERVSVQGSVDIQPSSIVVKLKKKRSLPLVLEQMVKFKGTSYPWLADRNIIFVPDSTT